MNAVVVAVKSLSEAKQRLSPLLTQDERSELARAMLEDVLSALARAQEPDEIAIVSCDQWALELARQMGLEIIREDSSRGETAAIELATEWYLGRGARALLRIPGDVPLVTPEDIDTIFRAASRSDLVLVPSRDGSGTNAILRCPPNVIQVRFGDESFSFHLKMAQKAGLRYQVLRSPRLELDIDTPEDLSLFAAAESRTRTHAKLMELQWPIRYR